MESILQRIAQVSNPMTKFTNYMKRNSTRAAEREACLTKLAQGKDLLLRLDETQKRLFAMKSAFECEKDFSVIEAYIYEINALELQYSHLFKLAKQAGIKGHVKALY